MKELMLELLVINVEIVGLKDNPITKFNSN